MPSFDPNPLVSHDTDGGRGGYNKLEQGPGQAAAQPGVLARRYPPGSTFKVVVAAAALENGVTPSRRRSRPARSTSAPTSGTFDPERRRRRSAPSARSRCSEALTESCNTALRPARRRAARRGQDQGRWRSKFGFEQTDLTVGRPRRQERRCRSRRARPATIDEPGRQRRPGRRWPSRRIGQSDVRMTPLQGALIAAAVANDGKQMRPYLVQTAARRRTCTHRPLHGPAQGAAPARSASRRSPATCRT